MSILGILFAVLLALAIRFGWSTVRVISVSLYGVLLGVFRTRTPQQLPPTPSAPPPSSVTDSSWAKLRGMATWLLVIGVIAILGFVVYTGFQVYKPATPYVKGLWEALQVGLPYVSIGVLAWLYLFFFTSVEGKDVKERNKKLARNGVLGAVLAMGVYAVFDFHEKVSEVLWAIAPNYELQQWMSPNATAVMLLLAALLVLYQMFSDKPIQAIGTTFVTLIALLWLYA